MDCNRGRCIEVALVGLNGLKDNTVGAKRVVSEIYRWYRSKLLVGWSTVRVADLALLSYSEETIICVIQSYTSLRADEAWEGMTLLAETQADV